MGTFLGVPIIRTIVFWGLYWGSSILGNYHLYSFDYGLGSRISIQEPFICGVIGA